MSRSYALVGDWELPRLDSNPSGESMLRKLLILGIARTEKNSKNAEPRYTAGTPDFGRDRLYFELNEAARVNDFETGAHEI
jgi:hypothetical protein